MPHIFTNAEYADMLYVYGFCDHSATAAIEEYHCLFLVCRIPDHGAFSKLLNSLHERRTLPGTLVSSEWAHQHVEEHENILEMVQSSSTTST
jgi:hypothetical protein